MDFISRMSDVKGIQDLCKLIVIPLMAAAYITSTGFEIIAFDFSLRLSPDDKGFSLWFFFILIFLAKVLLVSFIAALAGGAIFAIELKFNDTSKIFSIILLCFGFMGIATSSPNILPIAESINPYWYYSALAAGFYLPKMTNDVLGEDT